MVDIFKTDKINITFVVCVKKKRGVNRGFRVALADRIITVNGNSTDVVHIFVISWKTTDAFDRFAIVAIICDCNKVSRKIHYNVLLSNYNAFLYFRKFKFFSKPLFEMSDTQAKLPFTKTIGRSFVKRNVLWCLISYDDDDFSSYSLQPKGNLTDLHSGFLHMHSM